MKILKMTAICLLLLCLVGCAAAETETEETETIHVEENWQMNDNLVEMIQKAAGCNESRARAILELLREINLAEPVAASSAETEGNNIVVETSDGGRYEVGINRKYYAFSVKDLEKGEIIYMEVE